MKKLLLVFALTMILPMQANARVREYSFTPSIPVLEDKSSDGWIASQVDQISFDYKLPCDPSLSPYSAIVVQGFERMDLLTRNEDSERDVSIAYPRMAEFCVVIAMPKSGIVTNEDYKAEKRRTWWLTEGTVDRYGYTIRDEDEEIAATINLLKLAKQALGKPTYIVIGNDSGVLAEKVIMKLDETNEVNIIAGFIYVDKDTGEFTLYNSDQTKWESKDY
jgi:hypothetical protein